MITGQRYAQFVEWFHIFLSLEDALLQFRV